MEIGLQVQRRTKESFKVTRQELEAKINNLFRARTKYRPGSTKSWNINSEILTLKKKLREGSYEKG